jgi:transcriptional regulator with XRE-family HTH domain
VDPNPIDRHVGGRIRMRRHLLSMSQEKLADALGISFQQIQKYERGMNRIGASRLHQIASVLRVPVEFFYEGAQPSAGESGSDEASVLLSEFVASPGAVALMRGFLAVGAAQRRLVVEFAQCLSGEKGEADPPETARPRRGGRRGNTLRR